MGLKSIFTLPIMLALGALGMTLSAWSRRARFGMSRTRVILFALVLTAVGVTGACLLFRLEAGAWGGVSFYGSVFLIPLLMPLVGWALGLKPRQTMDLCGPCVAIMIGCLRFSCFVTGCCGGWTVCLGSFCFAWPTQILDSIGDFSIMICLLQKEERTPQSGKLYPIFIVAYSAMRFFLEFLRDTPKDWLYLSHGQWFAIVAILFGLFWIGVQNAKEKRNKR